MPAAFTFRAPLNVVPAGYVQMVAADLVSAVGLTLPANDANCVVLRPEGDGIRYRTDGTNPTASVGMRLEAGETLEFNGDLRKLKVIRLSASSILNCDFYDISNV